jgi:hypothetical protein
MALKVKLRIEVVAMIAIAATATAGAAPREPSSPHPRMLLDAELKTAWRAAAKLDRGPVRDAITLCTRARTGGEYDRALYQGAGWAKVLQACLVAWAATEEPEHAKVAIRFFDALLDDLERIGDGRGGDGSARRDSGYAIRNLGPYTALAYDWLFERLSVDQRAKARGRWAAWLGWYRQHGYRARVPGTNYHAGYLVAATMIAVAQAGEGGDGSAQLWRHVADELWGKDMAAALAPGGILDGGDWPEGWQYGPLSVTSYALAARIARAAGIEVNGVGPWLANVLRRHVYGMTPTDRVWAGGDTEDTSAHLSPRGNTLAAVALGDALPRDKRWAKGELSRLKLVEGDYLLHAALASVADRAEQIPRAEWPTWYVARATGTLFARTRWDERSIWFVAQCGRGLDVDHRHPNAGNFALTRGRDDLIVDPTPYGSRSTLTSNAPTVASAQLPAGYRPSQAFWGTGSGWAWATQTQSGVVAARCDYADAYAFQKRESDVPLALRDFVLVPDRDGSDANLVIIDRSTTSARDRGMHLRFRVPAPLAVAGQLGTATIGSTRLAITGVSYSMPVATRVDAGDCYQPGIDQGKCDAARFPVSDYRVVVPGPEPRAVHVISAAHGAPARSAPFAGEGCSGVRLAGTRDAVVVWPERKRGFSYRARRGPAVTHVILESATVASRPEGDECVITASAGGSAPPSILILDDTCRAATDPERGPLVGVGPRTPVRVRSGCCDAQTSPAASWVVALVVAGVLMRKRRRRTTICRE